MLFKLKRVYKKDGMTYLRSYRPFLSCCENSFEQFSFLFAFPRAVFHSFFLQPASKHNTVSPR